MLAEKLREKFAFAIEEFSHRGKLSLQGGDLDFYLLLLAFLAEGTGRRFLLITPSEREPSPDFISFVKELVGREVVYLPPYSSSLYPKLPPSLALCARRAEALYRAGAGLADVVVTPWNSLLLLPEREKFLSQVLVLHEGEEVDLDFVASFLQELGYRETDQVKEPGEFALRGGILDFFSPWSSQPHRLEFDEERLVSIRTFDPHSQRSTGKAKEARIAPLRDYPMVEGLEEFKEKASQLWPDKGFSYHLESIAEKLLQGEEPPEWHLLVRAVGSWEKAEEFFKGFTWAFLDRSLLLSEREKNMEEWREQHRQRLKQFYLSLPPGRLLSPLAEPAVLLYEKELAGEARSLSYSPLPAFTGKLSAWVESVRKEMEQGREVFVVIKERRRLERVLSAFSQELEGLKTFEGSLKRGFVFENLVLYGEENLFPPSPVVRPAPSKAEVFRGDFKDIKVGSPIVHSDYGVGIFRGLVKLEEGDLKGEYMLIEYADGEKLYLPVERFDRIYPFTVLEGQPVKIDRLSGVRWSQLKARARRSMARFLESLLQLYAERKARKGFSFREGKEWLSQFEAEFPFEETPDQTRAWEEVRRDMESPWPMDRLLVGDVGFGKTEIAMRAAFLAVVNGKQVAVLCPTTVLALQHLRTFRERFANFPVRIEALTRLTPQSEQKRIIEELKEGRIDIVIGTHRLLSDDVGFKDLGLLIIDEEQRFGVRHKEKIKELKRTVDCLTMTATPIPRTLSLALFNIWDMSIIQTPPKGRLAIETFVLPYSDEVFAQALSQELSRGGQVYVVCNNIELLEGLALKVKELAPSAQTVVLHGKMKAAEVERRMLDFIQGRYNVLVTTTIIENGVDIPNVNTLVVMDAHRFGLAQLYQLRGRVGRSTRQAYAYLFYSEEEIKGLAGERLKAIKEFSQLGSGFRLAAMDLQLRGAGTLLGHAQHGHMEQLGFDFYMKLLEETVAELKGEKLEELEVSLGFDLSISSDYIPQVDERINYYRRISSCRDFAQLRQLAEEMEDRFGKLHPTAENLFTFGRIKVLCRMLGIKRLERKGDVLEVEFQDGALPDPAAVASFLSSKGGRFTERGFTVKIKPQLAAIENILKQLYNLMK